jgi:hypothetical protein
MKSNTVFELRALSALGYTSEDIATILHTPIKVISKHLSLSRKKINHSLSYEDKINQQYMLDETLHENYQYALDGLKSVIRQCWIITHKTCDKIEKAKAVASIDECEVMLSRLSDVASDTRTVNDALKFISIFKENGGLEI